MKLNNETYQQIEQYLNQFGLDVRGVLIDKLDKNCNQNTQLKNSKTPQINENAILLVGNIGSKFWSYFIQSEEYLSNQKNPLDKWCMRIINEFSQSNGIKTIYPSDGPPYAPFQQWAKQAEKNFIYNSPIGALMHNSYGLWHAYRAAFVFDEFDEIENLYLMNEPENKPEVINHCDMCIEKPCLSTCPISAFTATGYDYKGCAQYLVDDKKNNNIVKCNELGCLARLSCPVSVSNKYKTEHHLFHLNSFKSAHAR